MKSKMLVAIALVCVAGHAVPAHAQQAEVVATVPFEFIVAGKVLPAGTYTVSTTTSLADSPILVSNRDHGAFLLPSAFDDTQSGNASLSFDQIGGAHILSQIKTPRGTYTIDTHREAERLTKVAQSNDHTRTNRMTSSGGQ